MLILDIYCCANAVIAFYIILWPHLGVTLLLHLTAVSFYPQFETAK